MPEPRYMHQRSCWMGFNQMEETPEDTRVHHELGILYVQENHLFLHSEANKQFLEDCHRLGFPVQSLFLETTEYQEPDPQNIRIGVIKSTVHPTTARRLGTLLLRRKSILKSTRQPSTLPLWVHKRSYLEMMKLLPKIILHSNGFIYWNTRYLYQEWNL